MSAEAWAAIASVLGAGGLYKLAELAAKYLERRQAERSKTALGSVRTIYNVMQVGLARVGAQRMVLLKLHNGGGPLRAGTPMFSSVLQEVWVPPLKPKYYEWGRERPDQAYSDLIQDVVERGAVTIDVDTMRPGKLRDLYMADGVGLSVVVHVATKRGEIYYLSTNFVSEAAAEAAENGEIVRGALRATASKIRGML